ncbi:MAG: nucleoside monophosphate kinase [Verrucomicrobiota bacterium]
MSATGRFFSLLGPPACGKGTQGGRLSEYLGVSYLSTGARLRKEITDGSKLGKRAQVYLDRNEYVPDELAIELVEGWLESSEEGWVLDGFPRSVRQAEYLLGRTGGRFAGLMLDVPEDELRERVTKRKECVECGLVVGGEVTACPKCPGRLVVRKDDSLVAFEKRLVAYKMNTIPVLEFLESEDKLVVLSGTGTVDDVWERFLTTVSS